MNHVDAPNVQAVLDVPDDLVELVSRQLWNVSEVSPDLLFVSRTWKNGLLPLLRSRKGWVSTQSSHRRSYVQSRIPAGFTTFLIFLLEYIMPDSCVLWVWAVCA